MRLTQWVTAVAKVHYLPVVVLLSLILPVIYSITSALFTLPRTARVLSTGTTVDTLMFAVLASVLSTSCGTVCAIIFERTEFPLRRTCAALMTVPLLIPPHVVAIAFGTGMGTASPYVWVAHRLFEAPLFAAVFVTTVCYTPLCMWIVCYGLRMAPAMQEQYASLYMPWHSVAFRITRSLVACEIAVGAVLVFLIAVQSFDVCAIVGLNTLMNEVFVQAASLMSREGALVAACPVLLCGTAAVWLLSVSIDLRLFNPSRRLFGASFPGTARVRTVWPALLIVLPLLVTSVLPIWNLLLASGGVRVFCSQWAAAAESLLQSALFSAGAVVLMVPFGAVLASAVVRAPMTQRRILVFVVLLPFAIPSSIFSLCLLEALDRLGWSVASGLAHGSTRMVMVLALHYLFPCTLIIALGWIQDARQSEDLASVYGLSRWARWRFVRWPLVRRHVLAGAVLSFALAMRELELYVLHAPPGVAPLPIRIFNTMHFGPASWTASLCLILAVAAGTPFLLLVVRRR